VSKAVCERAKQKLGAKILEVTSHRGDETLIVAPEHWLEVATFLRDDAQCEFTSFVDITAVDYPEREARFDLVLMLASLPKGHRIRLKTRLRDGQNVPTLSGVWPAANWFEREVWDMFGIRFDGHPDLRRLLMYEEFEGHPLRKDYPATLTQPLVPYRQGAELQKMPPFREDEGMPFSRRDWHRAEDGWGALEEPKSN
jgi:NADH-quinone oxidoreductase subunit C